MTEGSSSRDLAQALFPALRQRALAANAVGAAIAYVYLTVVAPPRPSPPESELALFLGVAPLYFVAAVVVGDRVGRVGVRSIREWLLADRPPTAEERELVLRLPARAALLSACGWLGAAVLFGIQTGTHHPAVYVAGVVLGIVLAGLSTSGVTYLLVERALRPVFAHALDAEDPAFGKAGRALRTTPRLLVSWALGSGVILIAIAVSLLGRGHDDGTQLAAPILFLVVAGLFAGGVLIAAAARSIAEPIDRVRAAVARVGAGDLDQALVVDDGGELGELQAGFNRMVEGLRERERIRELFGTYVDSDVAEHLLREGLDLAGEEVEVTVLFIDIRDFTGFAERASATEVVATINRLFARAVPLIRAQGGHVDKFVGDGLLAVFGAPRRQADHAERALAAALAIEREAAEEFGGLLEIGIGLNSGRVVAGNVGGAGRFEFSVIGDPVNVAARVEGATRATGDRVLLSAATYELLPEAARSSMLERPDIPLKGKAERVTLYAPR